ncbi:MAG: O-antigen ligase family protein [Planctomycetes bacterium]|nr:O-antigen ligase family protein [Planctomycetota bacterium]
MVKQVAAASGTARMLSLIGYILLPALAVHVAMVPVAPDATFVYPESFVGDIRPWWKSVLLVGIAAWMLVITVARLLAGWRPKRRVLGLVMAAAALAVGVSVVLSPYPNTALAGYTTLYEGAFALWAYVVGAWFTAEMVETGEGRLFLLRLIGGLAIFEALHGIAEASGWHLWQTGFGRWLMGAQGENVLYQFAESRLAYGTVFQPNHYGIFMAMLGALSFGMLFQESRRCWRLFWAVAYGGAVVAVICSQSRAGILTLVTLSVVYAVVRGVRSFLKRGTARTLTRNMSWGVVLVLCVPLLLLALSGPRRAVSRLMARFTPGAAPVASFAVESVGLENGRLFLRLAETTIAVEKDHAGDWRVVTADAPAGDRLTVSTVAGDVTTYTVPGVTDVYLGENRNGFVMLRLPGATLRLYAVGTRLWAVDGASGRLTEQVPLSTYEPTGYEHLASYRGYIWARSVETFARRPWFGHGPGTFALAFPNDDLYNKARFSFGLNEDKGHGVWATYLVEMGLVGFVFLLAPVVLAAYYAVRSRNELRAALFLGIIAYCICAMTNDSTVGVTPIFCVLVGLLACTSCSIPAVSSTEPAEAVADR